MENFTYSILNITHFKHCQILIDCELEDIPQFDIVKIYESKHEIQINLLVIENVYQNHFKLTCDRFRRIEVHKSRF